MWVCELGQALCTNTPTDCKTSIYVCRVLQLDRIIFLSSSLNKSTKHQTKPKGFAYVACVCAVFPSSLRALQKTWSQTSCHGSTVGTDDVVQVHTSQAHSHWQMPLTSNKRRCLLTEQRPVVSAVASQQDISEYRRQVCMFLLCHGLSPALVQNTQKICFISSVLNHGSHV